MNIIFTKALGTADTLLLFLSKDKQNQLLPEFLPQEAIDHIRDLQEKEIFQGSHAQVESFRLLGQNLQTVIVCGLDEKDQNDPHALKESVLKSLQRVQRAKATKLVISLPNGEDFDLLSFAELVAHSAVLSSYRFDAYKSEDKKPACRLSELSFIGLPEPFEPVYGRVQEAVSLAESVWRARDLVNRPANCLTPKELAKAAKSIAKEHGIDYTLYDSEEIQALGMGAFWDVAKGSSHKPRLIVLRYRGADASAPVHGLIGKGLTYDSGGYTIKPTSGMLAMKSDMAGAAVALCTIDQLAKSQARVNVTCVVAACENMLDGSSYKPGDVLTSMSGKTIEINNTDAEGRLTLADAVTFAIEKEKVCDILDIATLTGAAIGALGPDVTAVVCSEDKLYHALTKASEKARERIWRLPVIEHYMEHFKSQTADLVNSAGMAGAITAGMFVRAFTQDLPWIHLDIAGTAWADKSSWRSPAGGTGESVGLLYHYYQGLAEKE